MDSLLDVLTADAPEDASALRTPGDPPADYDRRGLVETVWKAGNYLRRLGAHEESTVAVVPVASAAVPLAIFGGMLNGATIQLDPPRDVDAKLLVAPAEEILAFDLPPGAQSIAHSGSVDEPSVHALGEGVWSENPFFPRDGIFVESAGLRDRDGGVTHARVVERVDAVLRDGPVTAGTEVVVRTPLDDVGTVVVGLLAPLFAGASVRLAPGDGTADEVGDVAVVDGTDPAPEPTTVRADRAYPWMP